MNRPRFSPTFAALVLCSLSLVACSVDSTGGAGEAHLVRTTSALDSPAVREVQLVVRRDDGTLEDFPITRWPVRTLDMIRTVPMSRLYVNERGYPAAFSSIEPPCEGVEYPPSGVPLDELVFDGEGHLLSWTLDESDASPCRGEEDERAFPAIAAEHDLAPCPMAGTEEQFFVDSDGVTLDFGGASMADEWPIFTDVTEIEIATFFEEPWDESRLFEDSDFKARTGTEVAAAQRDEDDYSHAP